MIRLAVAAARRAGSGGRPAAGGLPNAAQFNLCRAAILAGIMTNTCCSDSPKIGEQKLRLDMARAAAAGLQLQVTSACLELQVDDASDGGAGQGRFPPHWHWQQLLQSSPYAVKFSLRHEQLH